MGHSSTRAALVYLHSTSDRQRTIADAVGTAAKAALGKAARHPRETARHLARKWHAIAGTHRDMPLQRAKTSSVLRWDLVRRAESNPHDQLGRLRVRAR